MQILNFNFNFNNKYRVTLIQSQIIFRINLVMCYFIYFIYEIFIFISRKDYVR